MTLSQREWRGPQSLKTENAGFGGETGGMREARRTWIGTSFFLSQRHAHHGSGALTPAPEGAGGAAHGFETAESAPGRRASNFNC